MHTPYKAHLEYNMHDLHALTYNTGNCQSSSQSSGPELEEQSHTIHTYS